MSFIWAFSSTEYEMDIWGSYGIQYSKTTFSYNLAAVGLLFTLDKMQYFCSETGFIYKQEL